ncbi:hypothetical protein HGRIS_014548 [Hohenbuehelia grisea]|uniref:Ubiquitin-like protein ATG12 n=1 Tax=Hohenbuehelia grisea TaxID=104357 RepID=A0ABR3JU09_9AGAR
MTEARRSEETTSAALEEYKKGDTSKVAIRFKAIGNAPIMKKNVFHINASYRFHAVTVFLRKTLAWKPGEPLFTYINSSFKLQPRMTQYLTYSSHLRQAVISS